MFRAFADAVAQGADRFVILDTAPTGHTLLLLDATQALGWLPLDVGWADAVVTAGYKWLMCPRGAAWMSISLSSGSSVVC